MVKRTSDVQAITDADVFGDLQPQQQGFEADVFSHKPEPIDMAPAPSASVPVQDPGFLKSAAIAWGHTGDKVMDGLTQLYLGARGEDKALQGLASNVQSKEDVYKGLKELRPWATGLGGSGPLMLLPGANTLVGGATAAAIPSALGYGSIEDRASGALQDSAAALAGNVVGRGVGRVLKPIGNAVGSGVSQAASYLEKQGIPLTAGQKFGNANLRNAESALEGIPATSTAMADFAQRQRGAFTQAVAKTMGSDAAELTPNVMGQIRSNLGQTFTDLSGRNSVSQGANNQLMAKLVNVSGDVNKFGTTESQRIVNNLIDEVMGKVDSKTGMMDGQAYRQVDSLLGKKMRTLGGDAAEYIGQVRDALREAMDSSISEADKGAWKQVRGQYANLMTVAPVVARSGDGTLSPAALNQAVMNASKSAKFGGGGDLAQLAQAGKAVMKNNPNSGTAARSFYQHLMTNPLEAVGGAVLSPIPGATYGLTMTPGGQAFLSHGLLGFGQSLPGSIRPALARAGGLLGLVGHNAAQQP